MVTGEDQNLRKKSLKGLIRIGKIFQFWSNSEFKDAPIFFFHFENMYTFYFLTTDNMRDDTFLLFSPFKMHRITNLK